MRFENQLTVEDFFELEARRAGRPSGQDGLYVQAGGIVTGAGLALGPGYRNRAILTDHLDFKVAAVGSVRRYWLVETELSMPRLADGRYFVSVSGQRREFPEEDFYGLGAETHQDDRVSYRYRDATVGVAGGAYFSSWLLGGGSVEQLSVGVGPGRDSRVPSIEERFDDRRAPGLSRQPSYARYRAFVEADYTSPVLLNDEGLRTPDRIGNPRGGGRYRLTFQQTVDQSDGEFSFRRLEVDLRQYLSILHQRRIALHAIAAFSFTGDDQRVPFYFQPTLGGSRSLRGVPDFRFRDANLFLLQAEYRWEVFPVLDATLFYDMGQVAPRRQDFSLATAETNWGVGFRFGTPMGVFLRADMAFGGREGTQFYLKFNHVF